MSAPKPTPFRIEIPEDRLHDLRRRLASIRWAPDFANDDWRYGTNGRYLRELVAYWHDGYDWRAREKRMNAHPQFKVEIDGMPIHFLHVKAKHPEKSQGGRPLPLLLTHGWPWTFWDFEKVIGPLVDPGAHGGDPKDAFDVVVPSLPGFGFSTPLTKPGINWWRTADVWATLMRDVLGYERFCAHGGDWGALVTLQLGHRYADLVHGVHITGIAPLEFFSGDRPWSIGGSLDTIAKGTGERRRCSPGSAGSRATSPCSTSIPRLWPSRCTIRRWASAPGSSSAGAAGPIPMATSRAASRRTSCSTRCRSTGSPTAS